MIESYKKPFWKAVTWRIIASLTTMTLVYLTTGSLTLTLIVGIPESILKIIFYILHERIWEMYH